MLFLLFPSTSSRFVTFKSEPGEYRTATAFQDWIREHLTYLRQDEVGLTNTASLLDENMSSICNHHTDCRTIGGFYRTLAKGGDAYLPTDEIVWKLLKTTRHGGTGSVMRKCLADLKAQAAKIVASLVKPATHFAGADQLAYLTCIDARAEDVPWSEGEIQGEDDEDEDVER